MPNPSHPLLDGLNARAQLILRVLVERYLGAGEAVGSRTLSRLQGVDLSPASVRNVMADLEELGLLYAPHTSAGRIPTELGLRLFVDGLMEAGTLVGEERRQIERLQSGEEPAVRAPEAILNQASNLLGTLRGCASIVAAPSSSEPIKHLEFVRLSGEQALVVLVRTSGQVENRLIPLPPGLPSDALVRASNFLGHHMQGRTLTQVQAELAEELASQRSQLDALTAELVQTGIDVSQDPQNTAPLFVVRGTGQLLDDVKVIEDLERVRRLMEALETRETLGKLLDEAEQASGVQIFIGSDTQLFGLSGCSMILAPTRSDSASLVGMVGVIGPLHMNYGRIVPVVDYTAHMLSQLLDTKTKV